MCHALCIKHSPFLYDLKILPHTLISNGDHFEACVNGSMHFEAFEEADILSVVGQIALLLLEKERHAGEIYSFVQASQPTISRKIARMLDLGMIEQERSRLDRRVPIYAISGAYRDFLLSTKAVNVLIAVGSGRRELHESK